MILVGSRRLRCRWGPSTNRFGRRFGWVAIGRIFIWRRAFRRRARIASSPPRQPRRPAGAVGRSQEWPLWFHTNYEPNPWVAGRPGVDPPDRQNRHFQPSRLSAGLSQPRSPGDLNVGRRPSMDFALSRAQRAIVRPALATENRWRLASGRSTGRRTCCLEGPLRAYPTSQRGAGVSALRRSRDHARRCRQCRTILPWGARPIRAPQPLVAGRRNLALVGTEKSDCRAPGRRLRFHVNGTPLPAERAKLHRANGITTLSKPRWLSLGRLEGIPARDHSLSWPTGAARSGPD